MKVVYEEGERDRLETTYDAIREHGMGGLFGKHNPEAVYGLTFKVTNPAIAECILMSLLNDRLEDFDIGINIQSIDFDVLPKRSEIKDRLHEAIEKVLGY